MEREKWIKHYSNFHKILLVGEGNFSFAACLANAFGSATNIVATSLDDQETVLEKHPSAEANLETLENLGCTILYEVDARNLHTHPFLKKMHFDRIVFIFPHAGFRPFMRESEQIHIQRHQELVTGFFRSARYLLAFHGEIHVTHKNSSPFWFWGIEELGKGEGLSLVEEVEFDILDYPGYENKKGDGRGTDYTFPVGDCNTYKFVY